MDANGKPATRNAQISERELSARLVDDDSNIYLVSEDDRSARLCVEIKGLVGTCGQCTEDCPFRGIIKERI